MALQKREKALAGVTGGLLAVLLGFLLLTGRLGLSSNVGAQCDVLQGKVAGKEKDYGILKSTGVLEKVDNFRKRALPSDLLVARSVYSSWLRDLVDDLEFEDVKKISSSSGKSRRNTYTQLTFTVTGQATCDQLTQFLHRFYSADHLHKIQRLEMKSIPDSEKLGLTIGINALSLPKVNVYECKKCESKVENRAKSSSKDEKTPLCCKRPMTLLPQRTILSTETSTRLALKDLDAYQEIIIPRWMENDYFAERGGLFAHYQPKPPPIVERPPDREPEKVPDPPKFDHAKFAHVSAFYERDGRPQVWVRVRTQDKTLKLHEGESIEVGSMSGTIAKINAIGQTVEIEFDGHRRLFELGDFLHEGVTLSSN